MARKRTRFSKKRKSYRRRRRRPYKKKKYSKYRKPLGTKWIRQFPPTHLTTTMVWRGSGILSVPQSNVGTKRFIANNCWDPQYDTVSQFSCYNMDTIRLMYKRYLVLGSQISVTAVNPDNTNCSAFGILKTSDPSTNPDLLDWDDFCAQKQFRYKSLGTKNQSQALKRVTNRFSLKNDLGQMAINPVETTSALVDAAPATQYYYILVGAPFVENVANNDDIQFQIEIRFNVLFTGLKHIPPSET